MKNCGRSSRRLRVVVEPRMCLTSHLQKTAEVLPLKTLLRARYQHNNIMVLSRFFRLESTGIHQAAFLLALSSIANTVFALFRDRLLAGSFGASRVLDIYYAAFRLPDMLFSLSLFFVASTAFIPLYLEYQGKSPESARRFFGSVITLFLGAIVVLLCIAFLALPVLIPRIVPGFSKEEQETTRLLSSIMLFSPLFLGLSSIVSGVVQSSKRFLSYALAPIAYNGGIILGVLVFLPVFGASGLALGVVMGAFFHLVVQIPTLIRLRVFPRARFTLDSESLQIIWYSFPRAAALSVNQLTLMVLTALASTLGAGSIAIFNLSQNPYAVSLRFPQWQNLRLKKIGYYFFSTLFLQLAMYCFGQYLLPGFSLCSARILSGSCSVLVRLRGLIPTLPLRVCFCFHLQSWLRAWLPFLCGHFMLLEKHASRYYLILSARLRQFFSPSVLSLSSKKMLQAKLFSRPCFVSASRMFRERGSLFWVSPLHLVLARF